MPTSYINTELNRTDLLSKPVKNSESRRTRVRMILHDMYWYSTYKKGDGVNIEKNNGENPWLKCNVHSGEIRSEESIDQINGRTI